MKFKYTALGSDNQKLEGALEARSLELARQELHKMALSIINIEEVPGEEFSQQDQKSIEIKKTEGISTYYFLAKDSQKKEISGTIDAKDAYSAFRRLLSEYSFDVLDLTEPETGSFKSQFKIWRQKLKEEGVELSQKEVSGIKGESEGGGEKMNREIVAEIDRFILNARRIIEGHKAQYSEGFLMEIKKTLNNLERIRTSNNLRHITKVCNRLYELISHPDAVISNQENATEESYAKTVLKLKDSGFIAHQSQLIQAHNLQRRAIHFEKIQKIFARVLKSLGRKKKDEINKNISKKLKEGQAGWTSSLIAGLKKEGGDQSPPTLLGIIVGFFRFIFAPNLIVRRVKKQEMTRIYHEWRAGVKAKQKVMKESEKEVPVKKDFSAFFMELDSFAGWLLFFYITYFFLVSFSIEKGIGLPKELVLKTLNTPLILNVSFFLLFVHLAFTLKLRLFKANFMGSLFLFFFSFGVYTLLILNF